MTPIVHAGEWWIVRLYTRDELRDIVKVVDDNMVTDGLFHFGVCWYGWPEPRGLDSVVEWIRKVDVDADS